ncbi:hypothetical protein [Halothermothrix orenii]|uniref:Uncharacterized protein n=1 Tax=Halothermothrix orenii (strain H 168 / OCM 544 / DSM 9562) TaxID=373903 RepID=B8CX02_HALOH|nr:hypothetical protein [Halothermothrix orenii]ACL69821.1 hypothetical protein Hore_10660 [Halothermothrix orenii H 168]
MASTFNAYKKQSEAGTYENRLLKVCLKLFNINHYINGKGFIELNWKSTKRKGLIFFREDIEKTPEIDPAESEIDFIVTVLLPGAKIDYNNVKISCKDQRIITWIPVEVSEKELVFILDESENELKTKKLLKQLYLKGVIKNYKHEYKDFNKNTCHGILEEVVKDVLDKTYYRHPPGSKMAFEDMIYSEIKEVFEEYKIFDDFYEELKKGNLHSIDREVYPFFRDKPYGIPRKAINYMILAAHDRGFCRLYKKNGQIIVLNNYKDNVEENLARIKSKDIEFVGKGETVAERDWKECQLILKEFGYSITGNLTLKKQDKCWEMLVNIQNNMKEELEHAIRINSELCYLLEEAKQVKEINKPLFKLNHVMEQDFYRLDNDSYDGIKKFINLLYSTYGNVNSFKKELKEVKELLYFVRMKNNRVLAEEYYYLKKISLPLRGYEDLRMALITLLKKISNLKVMVSNQENFKSFLEELSQFKDRYKKQYLKEHLKYQRELVSFTEKLRSLKEYEALRLLSGIKVIRVAYNIKPIKKYIDTFFPGKCQVDNLDQLLDKQPRCNCGFSLGEVSTIPSLQKIKPMLLKGVKEYIKKLHTPKFKSLIQDYIQKKPDSLLNTFNKCEKLYDKIELINPTLIKEINKALNCTYTIKVSWQDLGESLKGSYPASNLDTVKDKLEERVIEILKQKESSNDLNLDNIIINLI